MASNMGCTSTDSAGGLQVNSRFERARADYTQGLNGLRRSSEKLARLPRRAHAGKERLALSPADQGADRMKTTN
jgi:hypothetical protein